MIKPIKKIICFTIAFSSLCLAAVPAHAYNWVTNSSDGYIEECVYHENRSGFTSIRKIVSGTNAGRYEVNADTQGLRSERVYCELTVTDLTNNNILYGPQAIVDTYYVKTGGMRFDPTAKGIKAHTAHYVQGYTAFSCGTLVELK